MNPTFKVGDELAFEWATPNGVWVEIEQVSEVNAYGCVTNRGTCVTNGWRLDGWLGMNKPKLICLATDEHREQAEHQRAVEKLKAMKWESKSLATLSAVLYLLNDQKRGEA